MVAKTKKRAAARKRTPKAQRSANFSTGAPLKENVTGILKEIVSAPAVKFVARGLAAALFAKLAQKVNDKYPEISRFITENAELVDEKLGRGFAENFRENQARSEV